MTLDSIRNSCNVCLLFPILSVEEGAILFTHFFYSLSSLVKLVKIAIRPLQAIWPVWKYVPLFSYFPAGSIVLKCLMGVEGLVACMGQILLAVNNKCIIVTITLTGLFRQILLDVNDKCRSVTITSFIIVTNWQTFSSSIFEETFETHSGEKSHPVTSSLDSLDSLRIHFIKDKKVKQMQPVQLYILPWIWGHIWEHTVEKS